MRSLSDLHRQLEIKVCSLEHLLRKPLESLNGQQVSNIQLLRQARVHYLSSLSTKNTNSAVVLTHASQSKSLVLVLFVCYDRSSQLQCV